MAQIVKAHVIQSSLTTRRSEAPFDVIDNAKNQAVWIVGCIGSRSFKFLLEARGNRDLSFLHCLRVERLNVQESIFEIDSCQRNENISPCRIPVSRAQIRMVFKCARCGVSHEANNFISSSRVRTRSRLFSSARLINESPAANGCGGSNLHVARQLACGGALKAPG